MGDRPPVVGSRFEIRRHLGAGATGAVYEAFDHDRDSLVALKSLKRLTASSIYEFKREFRSLADIEHPNLIKLYELHEHDGAWFFTMEHVRGVDFRAWVRSAVEESNVVALHADGTLPTQEMASPVLCVERARPAFEQLASGLVALHRAGKLHRDVKPSNVLVTNEGRVAVCDFGLARDVDPARDDTGVRSIQGTPSYMAPEIATGGSPSAAADWYSAGLMLYEAITGHLPIDAPVTDKRPDLRSLPDDVPEDLRSLCIELLRESPADRPDDERVLALLGVHAPVGPAPTAAPLIGRDRELGILDQAFESARAGIPTVALVHGASGMGKSALLHAFLEELDARADVIVLEGRCYEQESVPYKALDTVIDALSRVLLRMSDRAARDLVPRDALALSRLFPVLRRVDAVAMPAVPLLAPPDPHESRRRAFAALRELMRRLASGTPVVIAIDDLQWGDRDSAELLEEILRPPDPPPLLVVGAYRTEDETISPFLQQFRHHEAAVVDVPVAPLSDDAAHALLSAMSAGVATMDHTARAAIARESLGNPFLLTELAYHVAETNQDAATAGVGELVDRRLVALPPDARALLAAVAVAGRPVRQSIAAAAAGIDGTATEAIAALKRSRLVRTRGVRGDDAIETYHDRIRDTAVAALDAEDLAMWHLRLAIALENANDPDREALATHFEAAGDVARAAAWAERAAAQAAGALAFDRAAHLYRRALDLSGKTGHDATALREHLAGALVAAGRGPEAARAYQRAAEHAAPADALEYRRRAAEQLLRSGHYDDGIAAVRVVLNALGMKLPATPRRALMSLLLKRARIAIRGLGFDRRPSSEIPRDVLGRIDACWSMAAGLGMCDTLRGMDFQARHLMLALDAGDPVRVARALITESMYWSTLSPKGVERAAKLVARAREAGGDDPYVVGFATGGTALAAYQAGRFTDAKTHAITTQDILATHCTHVAWELDSAQLIHAWAMYYRGDLRELRQRVPTWVRAARTKGDLFAETCLSLGLPAQHWLIANEVDEARRAADRAMKQWSDVGFHVQHYWEWWGRRQIELYDDMGARAWRRCVETYKALQRSLLLRVQIVNIETDDMRARCAAAAAAASPPPERKRLLRTAARLAKRLERGPYDVSRAFAAMANGSVAHIGGDLPAAVEAFEAAERRFIALDMMLHASAARCRRGQLLGGDEGAVLVGDAETWFAGERVVAPAAVVQMLAPAPRP